MNRIITISRQFGSGGRTIGKLVAEKLGVRCYDKELTFAERIRAIEGVEDVTLIQYNGEYHG